MKLDNAHTLDVGAPAEIMGCYVSHGSYIPLEVIVSEWDSQQITVIPHGQLNDNAQV